MAPRYLTAIQYDWRHRGLQLALAYTRLEAGSPVRTHDIYGFMVGYCGGWAWGDEYFHVGEKIGAGLVSYTPAAYGTGWADDRVGIISGLADTDFAPGVEHLLESIRDYMSRRWICWTDDGQPDLAPSARRRLNCARRRVSYATPGINWKLLEFLHPVTGISFSIVQQAPRRRLTPSGF
jgi:hypothetical protein